MYNRAQIQDYLDQNPMLYVNLQVILDRGSAQVLAAGPQGLLLLDEGCGGYMMSAKTQAAADAMLELLPECHLFVGHELFYKEQVAQRYGLEHEQVCWHAVWPGEEPPEIPDVEAEIHPLDEGHAVAVHEHYSNRRFSVEDIRKVIRGGMTGAFVEGQMAGFIGFHGEGSLGLLEVLPQYRRRGLGHALLLAQTRLAMERGWKPFGQIITSNTASLALHRQAGFAISQEQDKIVWMF